MTESKSVTVAIDIHNRYQHCQTIKRVDKIFIHPNYTRILTKLTNDITIQH